MLKETSMKKTLLLEQEVIETRKKNHISNKATDLRDLLIISKITERRENTTRGKQLRYLKRVLVVEAALLAKEVGVEDKVQITLFTITKVVMANNLRVIMEREDSISKIILSIKALEMVMVTSPIPERTDILKIVHVEEEMVALKTL
jgi:hypothetical protein